MKQLDFKAVQIVNEKVQAIDPAFTASSPQYCYEIALWCATQRAYTGEQMAIAKKDWQDAKKKAYETFIASNEANGTRVEKYGVMVVKDYIAAKCGDYEARYEYIERTSAALDSMIKALMTVISSLKEEAKQIHYQRA